MTNNDWDLIIKILLGSVAIIGWVYAGNSRRELAEIKRQFEVKDRNLSDFRELKTFTNSFVATLNDIAIEIGDISHNIKLTPPNLEKLPIHITRVSLLIDKYALLRISPEMLLEDSISENKQFSQSRRSFLDALQSYSNKMNEMDFDIPNFINELVIKIKNLCFFM